MSHNVQYTACYEKFHQQLRLVETDSIAKKNWISQRFSFGSFFNWICSHWTAQTIHSSKLINFKGISFALLVGIIQNQLSEWTMNGIHFLCNNIKMNVRWVLKRIKVSEKKRHENLVYQLAHKSKWSVQHQL